MSRANTFIDKLLDAPTAAALGKVAVCVAAYVVGFAGWYRMWAGAWAATDPVLAAQQGAGMAVLVLVFLLVLTVALGVLMDMPGMERAGTVLARSIAVLLGGTAWLASLGLLYGLWLLGERVVG